MTAAGIADGGLVEAGIEVLPQSPEEGIDRVACLIERRAQRGRSPPQWWKMECERISRISRMPLREDVAQDQQETPIAEAAGESKRRGGVPVSLESVLGDRLLQRYGRGGGAGQNNSLPWGPLASIFDLAPPKTIKRSPIMVTRQLETRLAILEREVADLKSRIETTIASDSPWWQRIAGTFAGDPAYDAAMRLGRAYRRSLRPKGSGERKV